MIDGCVLNAECRLVASYEIGDHTMFVGEVLAGRFDPKKRPLLLQGASGYHHLGEKLAQCPFIYVLAGIRKDGGGYILNTQGRVFGAKEGDEVWLDVKDAEGKDFLYTLGTKTSSRGYFKTSLEMKNASLRGGFTVRAKCGELIASCTAKEGM